MNPKELSQFPLGDKNDAFAKYFVGQSYLHMLSTQQIAIANVTFEPGCRNHWHIHRAKSGGGQILLVTAGHGYYQEWGEKARELHPGDVVNIPANVKHWHGAAPDSRVCSSGCRGSGRKRKYGVVRTCSRARI